MVRTSLIYVTGIVMGVAVGVWSTSMRYDCPAFCLVGLPRFAAVECVLVGALTSIAVLTLALALNRDLPSDTAQSYRAITRCWGTVTHFLFEDLSRQREP